jgi:Tripartite tricarboxylate transporter family receptor.
MMKAVVLGANGCKLHEVPRPQPGPDQILACVKAGVLTRIISNPDLRERLLIQGFEPSPSTPDEFTELIKTYIAKNAKIVREAGIKVD